MEGEYKVVNSFMCRGKQMVVIEVSGNAACAMTAEEWKRLNRRNVKKK